MAANWATKERLKPAAGKKATDILAKHRSDNATKIAEAEKRKKQLADTRAAGRAERKAALEKTIAERKAKGAAMMAKFRKQA